MTGSSALTPLISERVASLSLLIAMVIVLTSEQMLWMYILLSYPHYLLAYFARHRARPYRLRDVGIFLVILGGFYSLSFVLSPGYYVLLASFIFLVHNFVDDIHLSSETPDAIRVLVSLPVLLPVMHMMVVDHFRIGGADGVYILCGLIMLGVCFYFIWSRTKPGFYTVYTLLFGVVLLLFHVFGLQLHPDHLFGLIVLSHGFNWYVKIGIRRWQQTRSRFFGYIYAVLIFNVVFVLAYIYNIYYPGSVLLGDLFFNRTAFAAWGVTHVLTTVRPDDYRQMFGRLPKAAVPS